MWFMHPLVASCGSASRSRAGAVNVVFSSPAANSGAQLISQTPWCRWMTSTRGTLPSA